MSEQANPKSGVPKSGVSKSLAAEEVVPDCPHCGKPLPLCICDSVTPIESQVSLLTCSTRRSRTGRSAPRG